MEWKTLLALLGLLAVGLAFDFGCWLWETGDPQKMKRRARADQRYARPVKK